MGEKAYGVKDHLFFERIRKAVPKGGENPSNVKSCLLVSTGSISGGNRKSG